MELTKNQKIISAMIILFMTSLCGYLIGIQSMKQIVFKQLKSDAEFNSYYETLIKETSDLKAHDYLKSQINSNKIREHLKFLTGFAHMAGTPGGKKSADYIHEQWKLQGLDEVQMIDYDVLLDFPNEQTPNNIEILDETQNVVNKYSFDEVIYDADLDYSHIAKPFLAFAANGSVKSDHLYFVNYCTEKDFEFLTLRGFNLTSKIALCRYGKGFRGNKIDFAQRYNMSGVLLFDDPRRSATKQASEFIYPNGDFLPPTGTQRGTVKIRKGDPLTPEYPANEFAHRNMKTADKLLPKIPAQVISYSLAKELFDLIELTESNQNNLTNDWLGELNTTYSLGGKLKNNRFLVLNVYNQRKISKVYNVIGMIRGSVEPDRYVLIGNHRDAWNFGALDPNSGTCVLLEVSRAIARLRSDLNWKPRRSIIFLSWDAEEFGVIGSMEWVEEFQKKLSANSVIYINMDTVLKGNYSLRVLASPLLFDFIYDVTKSIQMNSNETIYDRWLKNDPDSYKNAPLISPHIGASSDYAGFIQKVGIPCIEQTFIRDKKNPLFKNIEIGTYPTYHSSYETFNLVDKYLDPGFKTLSLIATVIAEFGRRMSDSLILPFNCSSYAEQLKIELNSFKTMYSSQLVNLKVSLDKLDKSINNFSLSAKFFHERFDSLNQNEYHQIRIVNDQLRNIEKAFLDPAVGTRREGFQHMAFSPSVYNTYGGNSFTAISDAIFRYNANKQEENSAQLIDEIKEYVAIVSHSINHAGSVLKDPLDFKRVF